MPAARKVAARVGIPGEQLNYRGLRPFLGGPQNVEALNARRWLTAFTWADMAAQPAASNLETRCSSLR